MVEKVDEKGRRFVLPPLRDGGVIRSLPFGVRKGIKYPFSLRMEVQKRMQQKNC